MMSYKLKTGPMMGLLLTGLLTCTFNALALVNNDDSRKQRYDHSESNEVTQSVVVANTDTKALLNWAIHLSRYENSAKPPSVRLENSAFFIDNACSGRSSCRVIGWYADLGIVHIHEDLSAMNSLFERSLLVHEFVHYLQHQSGLYAANTCESFVEREREAYAVQQSFFVAHGALPTIKPHHFSCAGVSESVALTSSR